MGESLQNVMKVSMMPKRYPPKSSSNFPADTTQVITLISGGIISKVVKTRFFFSIGI